MAGRFVARTCGVLGALLLAAPWARAGVEQKPLWVGHTGPVGIAVDGQGRLHVSWQSRDLHMHYAWIDGGRRHDEIVDATSACGDSSSIALDSAGLPHIAYHAARTGPLRDVLIYAHFDGSSWQREELSPGGYGAAIAIDASDQPHIVHAKRLSDTTYTLEYLHHDDMGWEREEPSGFLAITSPMSLALDSAGHAHVGMSRWSAHPLYATNASGSWVGVELMNSSAYTPSLVLDSLGHPHAVIPLTSGTVRYFHFDGAQWLSEDLYDPNEVFPGLVNVPWAAALALDARDRPQILFKTVIDDPRNIDWQVDAAIAAYHDGVEWRLIPLARRATNWTRLRIGANGVAYGAYALYGPSILDSQIGKVARIALPDVTGDWTNLAVSQQKGKSRVAAVLTMRNEGAGRSKGIPIALYLSADAVLDAGDTPIMTHSAAPAVAPGQTKNVKVSFARAGSLAGLYLIAVLDPRGRNDDLDRPNNTIAGQLPE